MGTLASAKYDEEVSVFSHVNEHMAEQSNLLPMSCYFGQTPDPERAKDFNRRQVKQLNDIDFEEDDEDDFEDVKALKRQRRTVLTEENLKKYLSEETLKVDIEHHYWLKDSFLAKIGRMAPNLQWLGLRRLAISNESFKEMVGYLTHVERLDISEC